MVTLKELAEKCGVSIATISNILNGKSNVSNDTRERILKIIKESGYRPNYMARGLRAAKTQTIGIIIEDLTMFSSTEIVEGIMSYLEEKGYRTLFENLRLYAKWGGRWENNPEFNNSVTNAFEQMLAVKVDGIVYIAGHTRIIDFVDSTFPVPVVIAYAIPKDSAVPSVVIDDFNAAKDMCRLIFKNGYKKPGIIAGMEDNLHTVKRLEGCKAAFAEAGIPFSENQLVYGGWIRESGYECCGKLLEKCADIDSIFCFNDFMAAGVYDYLNEHNLEVLKDIGVAGFDNRSESAFLNPQLTTVAIPLREIGSQSAKILLEELKDHKALSCSIIQRKSL